MTTKVENFLLSALMSVSKHLAPALYAALGSSLAGTQHQTEGQARDAMRFALAAPTRLAPMPQVQRKAA
ncbi:MAG: hypothetical protein E4H18_00395 [Hyphomicrobiales bacterium]|nr:MAG: hypothetical protein E4H18_00395 [Hyphomicrobiales bacterium]